jgi:hypothetical protein
MNGTMVLQSHNHRMVTLAGFPLSSWAFALRIWAAMLIALGAAFWLQLERRRSPSAFFGQPYSCAKAPRVRSAAFCRERLTVE